MGYFRFGRRFHLGPGFFINLSKSGLSWTVDAGPVAINFGRRGRRISIDLPGRGLQYIINQPNKKSPSRARSAAGAPGSQSPATRSAPASPAAGGPLAMPQPPTPGFFASATEKRFAQGLRALLEGDVALAAERFQLAADADTDAHHVADDLLAGISLMQAGAAEAAIPYLERVVASETPLPDEMMSRYVGSLGVPAEISPHVVVNVPLSTVGATLLLAEAYQHTGDIFGATGVLEALLDETPNLPLLRLALAELYYCQGLDEAVIQVTDGITADDDIGYAALTYRALALLAQGRVDAALDVASGLLRDRRKRSVDLFHDALFARGMIYDAKGQKAKARQDFERIYAQNSTYPGLREWLDSQES